VRIEVKVTPPYSIHVGSNLLVDIADYIGEKQVAIITDTTVGSRYAQITQSALEKAGKDSSCYLVAPGESSKSLASFEYLMRQMIRDGFTRSSAVLALGGGVIGDLAGYVAASFMRGVRFYQCPTSLLAMVDASIGGKTAINLPEGKNLVGAFWQPRAVVIDTDTLRTLSAKEFRHGAVELFKHGLLANERLLESVKADEFRPGGRSDFLIEAVAGSAAVKADIVAADERETSLRATLNLGHTLGHALEAVSDHTLPHGEAVAYGLYFSTVLAKNRGWEDLTTIVEGFLRWVQPAPLPVTDFERLEPYLARDKKRLTDRLRYVLLKGIGEPVIVDDVAPQEQHHAWMELLEVGA
jgi:3-dehydroquinate synthase